MPWSTVREARSGFCKKCCERRQKSSPFATRWRQSSSVQAIAGESESQGLRSSLWQYGLRFCACHGRIRRTWRRGVGRAVREFLTAAVVSGKNMSRRLHKCPRRIGWLINRGVSLPFNNRSMMIDGIPNRHLYFFQDISAKRDSRLFKACKRDISGRRMAIFTFCNIRFSSHQTLQTLPRPNIGVVASEAWSEGSACLCILRAVVQCKCKTLDELRKDLSQSPFAFSPRTS